MKKNLANNIIRKGSPVFFVLLGLLLTTRCQAQYDDSRVDSVILDTSVVAPGDIDSTAADTEESAPDEAMPARIPDTPAFRKVPDTTVERLQKQKDFAYANDPSYWPRRKKDRAKDDSDTGLGILRFLASPALKMILYSVLIAVLLFAFYRIIVVNKLFVFYSPGKKSSKPEEEDGVSIEDTDLDKKIETAIGGGDNRLATRYMYLKALQLLNKKGWIHYHPESTNHEYVTQVNRYDAGKDFQYLTRVYEYVWYGEFVLTREQLQIVQNSFKNFYKAVSV